MVRLYLYGTEHCHLCDEAEALIQAFKPFAREPFELLKRDIIDNESWYQRYETRIPVLENSDTRKVIDWPFTESDLIALL